MLSNEDETRVRGEALRIGADPESAVAEAHRLTAPGGTATATTEADAGGHPVADRLLIGFLPFVTVRELRTIWLKLDAPLPDDGMTCGEFQRKYAGAATAPDDAENPA